MRDRERRQKQSLTKLHTAQMHLVSLWLHNITINLLFVQRFFRVCVALLFQRSTVHDLFSTVLTV